MNNGSKSCALIGAPVQSGTRQAGCVMGPDALRTAGLSQTLRDLGHEVTDLGNVVADQETTRAHPNSAIHGLSETLGWIKAIERESYRAARSSDMPIILGGDHSISAGSVPAMACRAQELGQPQFVLWLDAHPDLHTLASTQSGNLHGTPVAYFLGLEGFATHYPPLKCAVAPENLLQLGLRSVDPAERKRLSEMGVHTHDMRAIDEHGIKPALENFLTKVAAANGRLHVSLDVDFLDPQIACAVGTAVPGGATFREAHLIMELLHDSGLVTSLDLVELNPFLDERGKTALLLVDLAGSLMGRTVLDRSNFAA